jgi:hypothetical protein
MDEPVNLTDELYQEKLLLCPEHPWSTNCMHEPGILRKILQLSKGMGSSKPGMQHSGYTNCHLLIWAGLYERISLHFLYIYSTQTSFVMKKNIFLLVVIFLIAGTSLSAQVEKGNWYINGLNIISFQAGSYKSSGNLFNSKSSITDFCYGPSFMYGVMNFVNGPTINYGIVRNLSGGVFMNLNLASEKDDDNNKTSTSIFVVGPVVRYYFSDKEKFLPFAEGKIGVGNTRAKYSGSSETDKTSIFAWYLGTGGTYFFKPKIGFDLSIGYGSMVMKDKSSQSNYKDTFSLFNIGIGMLVGL